jgi:periplasmic protein TonB
MTLTWSQKSFALSGSFHVGLLALLLVNAQGDVESPIDIQLIEVQSPVEMPKSKEAPKVTPVVSAPVVKTELKPISPPDVTEKALEEGLSSSEQSQIQATAEEIYKSQIARELNARKSYPLMAKKLRQQGRVVVQFNVARDGQIIEAKVVKSSPFTTLNSSAQKLVENLKNLNPFPNEIKKSTWLFQVPVDYQM